LPGTRYLRALDMRLGGGTQETVRADFDGCAVSVTARQKIHRRNNRESNPTRDIRGTLSSCSPEVNLHSRRDCRHALDAIYRMTPMEIS
jgi:hypothetical protein